MSNKKKRKNIGNSLNKTLSNIDLGNLNNSGSLKVLPNEETVKNLSKNFADIPLEQIEVNPDQPRNHFATDELNDLVQSLKVHGLIQPITVRRMAADQYQLISGERRWRAAKLAELETIPAFIRIANDSEMMEMALVENTHRADLNPIEIAITYQRLKDEYGLTDEALAQRVESSRTVITNYIGILKLPAEVQSALKEKQISMGHAKMLKGLNDYAGQVAWLRKIMEEGLSVRALEKMLKKSKEEKKPKEQSKLPDDYTHVQDKLSQYLGSKIQLKRNPKTGKGSISINFLDDSDLNRILELIEE